MFFRQYEYLVALAHEQHFGRAAERCHVSQPSLSNAIKQMELELGVPIVLRGQKFQGLTPEGLRVAEWAKRLVAYRNAMRDEIAALHNDLQGRLRLGALPTSSPILPVFTKALVCKHSGVQLDIQFLGIDAITTGLADYQLDIGITYLNRRELGRFETQPLYVEKLSLLVPDTEQFAHRTSITWEEAVQLPFGLLRKSVNEWRVVDDVFDQVGQLPNPVMECNSILHLLFHVRSGEIVTAMPSHFVQLPGLLTGTRALDLVDPIVSHEVGFIWVAGEPMLPMAKAMISVTKDLKRSGEFQTMLGELAIL